ncbi:GGGtGRT protein [bacterium]|uniref:GGGtGRT protein n=1 Tax=uncultured Victivallis sp. TaxID=354118 RepID=UPI0025973D9A|nr:GGGtGRT protein [uncultured Victivallis sp.]MBS5530816.1 GGGtGRT protein [bacterium]
MSVKFEGYERRIAKIEKALKEYGIESLEAARDLCLSKGVDVDKIVRGVQPIAFENAVWAYTLGAAIALKKGSKNAAEAAENIGLGLQAFCIPGSVADSRQVGIGHGNLAAMLLREETKCFCFLAGHESFAAAEGAIGIAKTANKVRKEPLRVILNGLGKDAAYIISRINGFTYVETEYDYYTGELKVVEEKAFSNGPKAAVKCYGADDVSEGVAVMIKEGVDVSITGNSTNPTRFQHPVAGTYKKWAIENGRKYFSVASGGGTGRTLHPDNMAAGPASYGMTDTMGRMHGDAQFAGSSSVPAHVEMMGLIGMGNNPMVGASVAVAVAVSEAK